MHYRVWAPKAEHVSVRITDADGAPRTLPLLAENEGFHAALDESGVTGDRYLYALREGAAFPCPASRFQPETVSGPSMVIDPDTFRWTDAAWARPAF
ncbi:MAG TPA: hypothetical protein VK961_19490, partial [Chthoniobacter sp.]|nr:hypothetical protein [Chthoniobacter sp.]